MPRPPLPLGTLGEIKVTLLAPGKYEARARFRDFDGTTRQVRKLGSTERKAESALKASVTGRRVGGGDITSETRIKALADAWLEEVWGSSLSTGTKQNYDGNVDRYIRRALGDMQIQEATAGRIAKALSTIRDKHGPGAAKSTRTVLSGMFSLAVRHDAASANPVRDAGKFGTGRRKRPRALTAEQAEYVTDFARSDEFATAHDLPDLIDWMLFTGCRIGEACAARLGQNPDGELLLDLDAGTWEINATVIRVRRQGLIIQDWTKSDAGWRVLALPASAAALVRRRLAEARLWAPEGGIFPAPAGKALRDPSNTPGDMRTFFDSIDCDHCSRTGFQHDDDGNVLRDKHRQPVRCSRGPYSWVTSHTFRKTVATRLEEAGWTARQVADQLGHSQPSMTQDVYFGRGVVNKQAAVVLDR